MRLYGVAISEHDLGHPSELQRALDALIAGFQDNAAYQIAGVYAWRGEAHRAFEWLDRAYAQRDPGLSDLKISVSLRKLHGDPRYAALLKRMNLAPD